MDKNTKVYTGFYRIIPNKIEEEVFLFGPKIITDRRDVSNDQTSPVSPADIAVVRRESSAPN